MGFTRSVPHFAHARKAIDSGEQSVTGMAKLLEVHRTTPHWGLKKQAGR
jgi:hypothetical protein